MVTSRGAGRQGRRWLSLTPVSAVMRSPSLDTTKWSGGCRRWQALVIIGEGQIVQGWAAVGSSPATGRRPALAELRLLHQPEGRLGVQIDVQAVLAASVTANGSAASSVPFSSRSAKMVQPARPGSPVCGRRWRWSSNFCR